MLTRTGIPLDVVYLSYIENGHSEQPPSEALATDQEPLIAITNTTSTG